MPLVTPQSQAQGRPYDLTQALSVFRPGLGTDVSLQLKDQLEEQRKKMKAGYSENPADYGGGSILSSLGVFNGGR